MEEGAGTYLFLVSLSVRRSVGPSHFTVSALMEFLALLLLPKCSHDLNNGPCPPARDWGSRVSGLVNKKRILLTISVKAADIKLFIH